jgi:hypothetical protein
LFYEETNSHKTIFPYFMKTTIDLPDALMMRVKLRAVQEQKKLKDAIAEWLERGMNAPKPRHKVRLPKIAKLKGRGPLTTDEMEAAINWGRD